MSHRVPPTIADRHIQQFEDAHPLVTSLPDVAIDSFSIEAGLALELLGNSGMEDETSRMVRISYDPSYVITEDVSLYTRWRSCRHVYRFDEALSRELCRTPFPDDMPLDALRRLPYPCLFVEAPVEVAYSNGGTVASPGFFCWSDRTMAEGATSINDTVDTLSIMMLPKGRVRHCVSIDLDVQTLGEAISRIFAFDASERAKVQSAGIVSVDTGGDEASATRKMFSDICAYLLYIVSEGSDQKVEWRPSPQVHLLTAVDEWNPDKQVEYLQRIRDTLEPQDIDFSWGFSETIHARHIYVDDR